MRTTMLVLSMLSLVGVLGCIKPDDPDPIVAGADSDKKELPVTLVTEEYSKSEMDTAIARARREVGKFIEAMSDTNAREFAVKAPIKDGEDVEHFWITNLQYANGTFTGKIGNEPGIVKNVTFGQDYSIAKEEISDWMYLKEGKMYGNYTLRPLLSGMPPAEAEKLKSMFAEP